MVVAKDTATKKAGMDMPSGPAFWSWHSTGVGGIAEKLQNQLLIAMATGDMKGQQGAVSVSNREVYCVRGGC